MTYAEKLKSPDWQKKRLEILQRDEFTCIICKSSEKELHVHHHHYRKNADPWDYDNENFVTYCVECHKNQTNMIKEVKEMTYKILVWSECANSLHYILKQEVDMLKECEYILTDKFI